MPHWRKVQSKDSTHLNHWDLEGNSPINLTISEMDAGEVYNQEKGQGVMLFAHFKGAQKALGLCATNCAIIEAIAGTSDYAKWPGTTITLRTATCNGDPCVRVQTEKGAKLPRRYPKFDYADKAKPQQATKPKPQETKGAEPRDDDGPPEDWQPSQDDGDLPLDE